MGEDSHISSASIPTSGTGRSGGEQRYGLHEWMDKFENRGTELLGQHRVKLHVTQIDGLFVRGKERICNGLAEYFHPPGDLKRKVFVVVDSSLPENKASQIQDYFVRCKMQGLLDAYTIWPLASRQTELTLENVMAIASASKQFGIRRRDLLIAIGGHVVTEVVGFAAAIYRRGTPWISIPTDPIGILRCHDGRYKVSVDHVDDHSRLLKGLFALSHLPVAGFYDLNFLDSWPSTHVTQGLTEIIKIAVLSDKATFSYIEARIDNVLANTEKGHLTAAIKHCVKAISRNLSNNVRLSRTRLDEAATWALEQIQGAKYGDEYSRLMGIALASALSIVKGKVSSADLSRILYVLDRAGLSTVDFELEPEIFWEYMTNRFQEWYGDGEIMILEALGKETNLNLTDISLKDVTTAFAVVRERSAKFFDAPHKSDTAVLKAELSNDNENLYEWITSEDVRYHVASVQEVFKRANPAILQNYCVDHITGRKMKILVVMDDYTGNSLPDVRSYFEYHRAAIDRFAILPVHVISKCKTIDSVLKVTNAALDLQLSPYDLFIVVGGGTLMDIVGFVAAMYKGGTRYLKIPTTLVGMIDAGIAVKVGVNLGNHKNLLGSYFAPVACLNDPGTFLATLPRRQLSCGLAEAVKVAVIKSPRVFEIIARHLLDFTNYTYVRELIQISIHAMLEELQPNLREESLMRTVDFGHEFGHIIESLAHNEVPHGECVAVGMGIATYIAYLKGIVSQTDLNKILYLVLDTGLPIYVTNRDCCNPAVLWAKISTDGIEHKHGMLYLTVPETIGRASFVDHLSDIDAGMITESIHALRRYAEWYVGRHILRTNGNSLQNSEIYPADGIYLSVENSMVRRKLEDGLIKLQTALQTGLAADGVCNVDPQVLFPANEWRLSFMGSGRHVMSSNVDEARETSERWNLQEVISRYATFRGTVRGMYICSTKAIVAQVITDDDSFNKLRSELTKTIGPSIRPNVDLSPYIILGTIPPNLRLGSASARLVEEIVDQELLNQTFGQSELSSFYKPSRHKSFVTAVSSIPPPRKAGIIGASGDIGSALTDYLVCHNTQVVCSIRAPSLDKFKTRTKCPGDRTRVLIGDAFDLSNLRAMISEVDVVYNLAGIVTLGSQPHDFPKVLAVNGFAQGIMTHLVQQAGRDGYVKIIFPSTQRVHLTSDDELVAMWVHTAAEAFAARKDELLSDHQDIYTKLESFARDLILVHPLPTGFDVYEISKRLGEYFVSSLSRYSLVRISDVYGPTVARGFVSRAIHPKSTVSSEARERRDFVYIDDVIELLFKAAQTDAPDSKVFDAASGESIDLQDVWRMVREMIGDDAVVVFQNSSNTKEEVQPNLAIARRLLGRDLVSIHVGLQESVDGHLHRPCRQLEPTRSIHGPGVLQHISSRDPNPNPPKVNKFEAPLDNVTRHRKPPVIAIDVGATYYRTGVLGPDGVLLHEPARSLTPSKQSYPEESLSELQQRLIETLVCSIASIRRRHASLLLEEVAISLGAVVTMVGVIRDASILWGDAARGFNFKQALEERVPGIRLTILNDVSAAAWRYKDEGRFCLITVSSGLSNKVFNTDLRTPYQLDLDAAGIGGEMGHVVVNPRQVDALVLKAITQATLDHEGFEQSKLSMHVSGNAQKINARHIGKAAKENDRFTLRLLEEADVPLCPCGNLADLCSYSSGRAVLNYARALAARGDYEVASHEISDAWLQRAISTGHPMALKILYDTTYPLALRILQLAADIGLDKFIIVGGFALKTGGIAYLQALQDHLVRFYNNSAYFADWTEPHIRNMVKLGIADDNDGLIGIGNYVHHLRSQYRAAEKDVGEPSQKLMTRSIPRCGARQILVKVVYAGICTTDLQILRAERKLEPKVLGHEGVCQVMEVGEDVRGVNMGSVVVLNPNNPLDEHDKLGHTVEGVFQEYFKFGQELVDKNQVLVLDGPQASATDTLVEPLSCVVAAQERMKDRLAGKNVLIVGAGVMGLMFALTSVKYGARHVFLANRSRERLDFAVAKGITQQDKVFVIGPSVSSQIQQVTAGEGVDIVVICVSMGQGVDAAQDAVKYINAGGCVYLFAGFRPGDVMVMDGGVTVDAWAIRSGWKTERIEISGRPIDISGHRGSKHKDLEMAVGFIRGDTLSFSRVISHVISLDVLPEIAVKLTQGKDILGRPAKRVIVDMEARDGTVELAEYFPLRHLQEAARRPKNLISRGNPFRELGFDGESSMLGWVIPPSWQQIVGVLNRALQMKPLALKQNFIFCGTGAWAFSVDALRDLMSATHDNINKQNITIHTLSSLDPQALFDLFLCVGGNLNTTVCIGVSQSGTTLETVMLMNAMRERFDSAGLDYRDHFIWLTDMNQSSHDDGRGETMIRASEDHDWKDVSMVPLTVGNHADINALFGTPHSTLAFLTMAILCLGDLEAVRHLYQQYTELIDEVSRHIVSKADHVASKYIEDFCVHPDDIHTPAMAKLIIQLISQSLGSKQAGFNPQVQIIPDGHSTGSFEILNLPIPVETPAPVRAMLAMYALSVFVAVVGYHRNISFVTHPKVDLYKRRAKDLVAAPQMKHSVSSPPELISNQIIMYLDQHPQTRFVEIVCYWMSTPHHQDMRDWLISCLGSRTLNVHVNVAHGSDWNHSMYQRAVEAKDSLYVILELQGYRTEVEGISEQRICTNVSMLRAITRATYETLVEQALYFIVDGLFFQRQE
ncbi:3-dehydroquinate synthase-domain-containing protein [Xylariaceae sp. AK1471]|nr:3-dehydroquinate synthase-domain-containing protein [Xylariaceae sp. AK1471]